MDQSFSAFFLLCLLLTITPGADTALVIRSSLIGGRAFYFPTIFGICAGLLFHASLASLGLSAIIQKSAELYTIIQLLGAGYLIYLGSRALMEAWVSKKSLSFHVNSLVETTRHHVSAASEFRKGLFTNILNPKVAVFYLTFLPQFIDVQESLFLQSISLASIHIAMSFFWLWLMGSFVTYFASQLTKPKIKQALDSVTGVALVGFGLRLLFTRD